MLGAFCEGKGKKRWRRIGVWEREGKGEGKGIREGGVDGERGEGWMFADLIVWNRKEYFWGGMGESGGWRDGEGKRLNLDLEVGMETDSRRV